jgi:hypothetical protein
MIKSKMNLSIVKHTIDSKQYTYDFELKCAETEAATGKSFAIGFGIPNPEEEEYIDEE